MLTYDLHTPDRHSLYEQLYLGIRNDIEHDQLRAGDKLPSKRTLAQHLGVSVITVESAYRQLIAEGYIEARERKGYFVSELPSLPKRNDLPPKHQSNPAQTDAKASESPLLLADFSGTHRSGNLFPFSIWAKTVRQTLNEASKGRLLRTSYDTFGAEELRQAITRYLANFRGIEVDAERVVIGAGAQDLYGVLVQLLGRDRSFAIEDPGYPALRTHYELSGATVCSIPVDEKGMVVSELSKTSASIAHCTPAHQFPTGSVMSADRRRELYAWAHTEDNQQRRYIIEDDYDSEFRMRGRPIPPLYAHDAHESVIYLNTFTRSLGGVFRIAYMVLPAHLVPLFKERFAARSCTVGALEQLELARFIDSGNYERHVNRQRTIYRRLQDSLIARLSESPAHAYVKFRNVDAGLHFLMDVDFSSLQENGLEIEHSCAQTPGATDLFDLLEQRALAAGMRLAHIDDYRFEAALLHVGKAKASQQEKRATQTRTYVMNLSGLDANRADEIGQALARAIESLVK